ncbi:hypothetical protein FIBSPDRAFT_218403 [Athelia psychrophila]|uniref:Uncharacterized protein n=1 Tax=Athelia psychrophila TaxID=1759441 RepID=A0A165Z949_9AGAM|nr:hypothetical protein FIBSPDRAFT_218403 [Fibularhizoctonia sp. CBS 109695]
MWHLSLPTLVCFPTLLSALFPLVAIWTDHYLQSQNKDLNEKPAVIAKTPQHHLGKAISTRMKPGPTASGQERRGKFPSSNFRCVEGGLF